jgi:hypothetical protein
MKKSELTTETPADAKPVLADSIFKYLEVKSYENGEVVKRLDVSNESDRSIDRIERGLNINLNHEAFYTFSYESEYMQDVI